MLARPWPEADLDRLLAAPRPRPLPRAVPRRVLSGSVSQVSLGAVARLALLGVALAAPLGEGQLPGPSLVLGPCLVRLCPLAMASAAWLTSKSRATS